jgi:integrase
MKTRYRLVRRGSRGDTLYCVDTKTGKRTSLQTNDPEQGHQIIEAKNQAERQPVLNLQIAKAYLAGSDSGISQRTWQEALDALTASKRGANQQRWQRAAKDKAFDSIRHRVVIETQADMLLKVLQSGTVSTNIYLRRLHNFCLDMNWLPWPIIPKRQWPEIKFKDKRAITWEEHQRIVTGESNRELRDYYDLLWYFGASQTDMASLRAEDVDWTSRTLSYVRLKTASQAIIRFGDAAEKILRSRPDNGYLFPQIVRWKESDRAKAFSRRCRLVNISGVSLHSYRYAWAERARTCGFPERFAQEALGHGSKAVARAYAKKARVLVPSLEEYEQKIVPLPSTHATQAVGG